MPPTIPSTDDDSEVSYSEAPVILQLWGMQKTPLLP